MEPDQARLIADLFSLVPVGAAARQGVLRRMADTDRHYHGTRHLAVLWGRHLRYGAGLPVREVPWHRLIASAIAFHDAIYDPTRRDNEALSATLWRDSAPVLEPWEIDWVSGTILATADHLGAVPEGGMTPEAWSARLWMLDLDLTPLGEEQAEFERGTAGLRAEYAHLDDAAWNAGRDSFLRGLAARPVLFRTPLLASVFEAQARANLDRKAPS